MRNESPLITTSSTHPSKTQTAQGLKLRSTTLIHDGCTAFAQCASTRGHEVIFPRSPKPTVKTGHILKSKMRSLCPFACALPNQQVLCPFGERRVEQNPEVLRG
ncbi:hypothetical protein MPTK1_3g14510 [Marchantia polymorpha subsp. ruderalis]|uniref:Uncharacterized protein n=2 Tax=Marchantia polymorpha TaxID=3197 RepID=A0AAF6B0S1_MARPO|nr:hypothetical protein MARPO_0004s0220 [Marchantia polymorpha]BBN05605.1 hypothetical protein Mp_3g14510 [Marchantia polymorpha subsp. ruderalis]|eukprot:PTQ48975.1 hypothetical protein MARPO_0004s0220 [Marchantia polymorpha]